MQSIPYLPTVGYAAETETEAALVQRARQGDQAAITGLYERHAPATFRYFYIRVKDRCLAEDLTGEVFLQVVEALPRYEERGRPFAAWVFRIARYRIIDYYRRARLARLTDLRPMLADTHQEGSETSAMRRVEHRNLYSEIAELTDEQKTVVQLRFFEGYSLDDTATIVGKSATAVKALQHRALQQLGRKLVKQHDPR